MDIRERARLVLAAAGLPPDALAVSRPLPGGTYNAVEELRLTDGSRYMLKIPPPLAAPGLAHERNLLAAEAEFYRAAATVGVPAPEAVGVCTDASAPTGRYLLMTACPGDPWGAADDADRAVLRTELGGLTARLHRVTGPGFGYPSGALGPLAADWRTAFTAMYEAVLDDARRYGARLPRPVDEVARTAKRAYDLLDEVTEPRLVHFDLWRGNILVDRAGAAPRIGGLIDGERMLWGDPVADFVSLALLGDITRDEDFLTGYRAGDGPAALGPPARRRLALYRSYLYLIMLTETVPRAYDPAHVARVRAYTDPALLAALAELDRGAA
ncbi:phosphotransferase family protein [Streptomyces sp. NPDC059785]|uniref:phosphotransferase family protein n=1 Tax=unclassified Streptomyces TaxID=2593676 RepID=UPI0036584F62